MFDYCAILDRRMRKICDLDPSLAISPLTVEDLTSGEHTLQLGYPITGPGRNVHRATIGKTAWEACTLTDTEYSATEGGVVLEQEIITPEVPAGTDVSREETGASLGNGTLVDVEAVNNNLQLKFDGYSDGTEDRHSTDSTAGTTMTWHEITFKAKMNAVITKVTYRSRSTGAHSISFQNASGVELAKASGSGVASGSWYTFALDTPVSIAMDTSYKIYSTIPSGTPYRSTSAYNGTIWQSTQWRHPGGTYPDNVPAIGLIPGVIKYKSTGYKIWQPLNLSAAITAAGSLVEFTKATPTGTTLKIYALLTSSDVVPAHDAVGWEEQTHNTALTVVSVSADMDGKRLWLMAKLTTTNTSVTPSLSRLYAIVEGQEYEAAVWRYKLAGGTITLEALDASAVHKIAKAVATMNTTLNGQTITLEMSTDAGVTWGTYEFDYDTDTTAGLSILARLVLTTTDTSATPVLHSLIEDIYTADDSAQLTGGHAILIKDPDGDFAPFEIKEDNLSIYGTRTRGVRCKHLFYELADGEPETYNLVNAIPSTAIAAALTAGDDGTRWEVGNIDASLTAITKDLSGILQNPLQRLRQIEREYEARLKFRVEVDNVTGITGYYVDLLEIDEEFKGQRFEFGWNLQGIDIQVNCDEIKTALIGTALGDSIDLDTGDPKPLTFEDEVWTIAGGDPADKPAGQNWVGCEEARLLYGIPKVNSLTGEIEMLHRFGIYESQSETAGALLSATWLIGERYRFRPQVSAEAAVADLEQAKIVDIVSGALTELSHEKIRLGNVCYVKAESDGLIAAVDVKINRVERYLKKEEAGQTRVLLGDPILLGSDYIAGIEGKVDWKDKRRRKLDRGRGGQTVTVASEDTSLAPYYASVIIKPGEMLNDRWAEIMALLPANGGQILIQEGNYVYDGNIELTMDNITISGQGAAATKLTLKDSTNATVYGFYATGKTGIKISDLTVDGNKVNQTSGTQNAALFLGCADVLIESVIAQNFYSSGVRLETVTSGSVARSTFRNNRLSGLNINTRCSQIDINNCVIVDNEDKGIRASDSSKITINANKIEGEYAVYMLSCDSCAISGNTMRVPTHQSLRLDDCHNCAVTGNECSGGYGISLRGSTYNAVTGNVCNGGYVGIETNYYLIRSSHNMISGNTCCNNTGVPTSTGVGIWLQSCDYSSVQANKCNDNARYGISISSGDTGNLVSNNDLYGNGIAGLLDSGAGTITSAGNRT